MKQIVFGATFGVLAAGGTMADGHDPQTRPDFTPFGPPLEVGAIPDEIHMESLADMAGLAIDYVYSSGSGYSMRFYDDRLAFRDLGSDDDWVAFPYRAREIAADTYYVHFLIPATPGTEGASGHVALLMDLEKREIHAAGLIPAKAEQFDFGEIVDLRRNF